MVSSSIKALLKSTGRKLSLSSTTSSKSNSQDNHKNSFRDDNVQPDDEMFIRLLQEAAAVVEREPMLSMLLSKVGLLDETTLSKLSSTLGKPLHCTSTVETAQSFEEVISRIVSHRLSSCSGGSENICPNYLRHLLEESFSIRSDDLDDDSHLELGHTMSYSCREDAMAILKRDPAVETLLEAVLFMKGFHALVLHRAARRAWKPDNNEDDINNVEQAKKSNNNVSVGGKRFVALLLQSQASAAFGVDIHPACSIGAGVMIDHASGVVIGETAVVGDGTTILHGVTLGGTGKDHGDRHPKIGKDVLIGAGTKILGNVHVGDRCKIGAGSVVLRPIPSGATAVGAPAKILGFTAANEKPGTSLVQTLDGVEPLLGMGKKVSSTSTDTTMDSTSSSDAANTLTSSLKSEESKDEKREENNTEEKTEACEEEEEEDDDNITDFGTKPKICWKKIEHEKDDLCPFSGSFRDVSQSLKQTQCLSHEKLRALLIQEGCSEGECVEVFFALLHYTPPSSKERACGCIPLNIFKHFFPEIAKEKTTLDDATIEALATGDLRALGMSKKVSKRFKSVFDQLGKVSELQQINESSSMHEQAPAMSQSFKEAATLHLDTAHYSDFDFCV